MRMRSAFMSAAVAVLCGFAAVPVRGQVVGPQTQVIKPGPGIVDPVVVRQVAGSGTDEDFAKGTYPEDTPGLVEPVVISQPAPKYTIAAMRAKIPGEVHVDAVIGTDGTVVRARIARSLDTQYGLDDEALKAVKQWTFKPGSLKGEKVPVLARLVLTFRLH